MPRLTLPGAIPEIDLWRTAIVAPGPDPFASLAEILFADKALGAELRQGAFRTKEILAKQLAGDVDIAIAPLREALDKAAQSRKEHAKYESVRPARLALAIDQAERLFVEADADVAKAFVRLVADTGPAPTGVSGIHAAQRRLCAIPGERRPGGIARGRRDIRPRAADVGRA